jgi:hypothetical protein
VLDDWKVNSKLTLNIGLRTSSMRSRNSPGSPIFDPTLEGKEGCGTQNRIPTQRHFRTDPTRPAFGYLDRETQYLPDKNNWAPRFGFAFRPFDNNRTVIRGLRNLYYVFAQLNNLSEFRDRPPRNSGQDLPQIPLSYSQLWRRHRKDSCGSLKQCD